MKTKTVTWCFRKLSTRDVNESLDGALILFFLPRRNLSVNTKVLQDNAKQAEHLSTAPAYASTRAFLSIKFSPSSADMLFSSSL